MCGPFWRTVVSSRLLSLLVIDGLLRNVKPVVPVILTRARFGEDCAEAAVGNGLEQYVIVGAGYETFAMRRTDLMTQLTVYELDQAPTQEAKLLRMQKAGIKKPDGVRYVQCDLNVETLQDALGRAGFDEGRPAMFSWFGVTYYLGLETIRKTLADIAANMAPGSTVMFDYLADLVSVPDDFKQLHRRCSKFVARRGEPWLSSFNPPQLPGILKELGYSDIENLEPGMVADRYWSSVQVTITLQSWASVAPPQPPAPRRRRGIPALSPIGRVSIPRALGSPLRNRGVRDGIRLWPLHSVGGDDRVAGRALVPVIMVPGMTGPIRRRLLRTRHGTISCRFPQARLPARECPPR